MTNTKKYKRYVTGLIVEGPTGPRLDLVADSSFL